ncbi:unnamed protein product [Candidula unifasciata]|uniref:Uncharacterized protein n=1 Tax=Candidula unifasciata TaxID=100452 RepID=A0A8S3YQT0_9EUPU|nr:unnamed protein product [Candidula unifasciata]
MHCPQQVSQLENGFYVAKKRRISSDSADAVYGRRFLHLQCMDSETIFHTEDCNSSGSSMFSPLTEDLMINTRNIEQFSCSRGNFFVSGADGLYSKTISGEVLHLWRFCPQKRKLFISRSFLFKNAQDFHQVRQMLQRL